MSSISSNASFDILSDPVSNEALGELSRISPLVGQQEEERGNCPICLEPLSGRVTQNFHSTGPLHAMHTTCFSDFIEANRASGSPIPCPSCRIPYASPLVRSEQEAQPRPHLFRPSPYFDHVSEETYEEMDDFVVFFTERIEEDDFTSFSREIHRIRATPIPIILLERFFLSSLRCCIEKNKPRFLSELVQLFHRLEYLPFEVNSVYSVGCHFDQPILSIAAKSGSVELFQLLIPGLRLADLPIPYLSMCIKTAMHHNKLDMVNYLTSSHRALSALFRKEPKLKEQIVLYYERIGQIDLMNRFFPLPDLSNETAITLLKSAHSFDLLTKIFIDSNFNPKRIEKNPILFEIFQTVSRLNHPPVFSVLLEKTNLKHEKAKLFPILAGLIQSDRFELLKIASKHVFLSDDQLDALKEYARVTPGRAYLIDPLNAFPRLSPTQKMKRFMGLVD